MQVKKGKIFFEVKLDHNAYLIPFMICQIANQELIVECDNFIVFYYSKTSGTKYYKKNLLQTG